MAVLARGRSTVPTQDSEGHVSREGCQSRPGEKDGAHWSLRDPLPHPAYSLRVGEAWLQSWTSEEMDSPLPGPLLPVPSCSISWGALLLPAARSLRVPGRGREGATGGDNQGSQTGRQEFFQKSYNVPILS